MLNTPQQSQKSLPTKHFLMLVIICGKYEKIPSQTADVTEGT